MEAESLQYKVKAFDEGWALGRSQGYAGAVRDLTRSANNRRIGENMRAGKTYGRRSLSRKDSEMLGDLVEASVFQAFLKHQRGRGRARAMKAKMREILIWPTLTIRRRVIHEATQSDRRSCKGALALVQVWCKDRQEESHRNAILILIVVTNRLLSLPQTLLPSSQKCCPIPSFKKTPLESPAYLQGFLLKYKTPFQMIHIEYP
jgi:hypothetical protein